MRSVLLSVFLLVCTTPLLAQRDGAMANGEIVTSAGDTIRFRAHDHLASGEVRGEMTVSGDVSVSAQIDCLIVVGNRAVMSGTVVDSSVPELIGTQTLLAVEDNGQGNNAPPDRFTWIATRVGDCHAFSLDTAPLEEIVDGRVHVKASNVTF